MNILNKWIQKWLIKYLLGFWFIPNGDDEWMISGKKCCFPIGWWECRNSGKCCWIWRGKFTVLTGGEWRGNKWAEENEGEEEENNWWEWWRGEMMVWNPVASWRNALSVLLAELFGSIVNKFYKEAFFPETEWLRPFDIWGFSFGHISIGKWPILEGNIPLESPKCPLKCGLTNIWKIQNKQNKRIFLTQS